MTAISFVSSAIGTQHNESSTLNGTIPSGIQGGDVLFFCIANSTNAYTGPAGWTLLGETTNPTTNPVVHCWWKYADANDVANIGATIAATTKGTGAGGAQTGVFAYRGANVDPVAVVATSGSPDLGQTMMNGAVITVSAHYNNMYGGETGSNTRYISGYGGAYLGIADWLPSDTHTVSPLFVNGGVSYPPSNADAYIAVGLEYNPPPGAPTVAPFPSPVMTGKPLTVSWTPSDPDGDPQAKAQVRYRKV